MRRSLKKSSHRTELGGLAQKAKIPLTGETVSKLEKLPWDFVGVISCDFVDRFFRGSTDDPRASHEITRIRTDVISSF
jgi:hypothetical protein